MSLEMARIVVVRLRANPELVRIGVDNLIRWNDRNGDAPSSVRCYHEWMAVIDQGLDTICSVLLAETDEGQRMRQNSPFPGVLGYDEVLGLKQRIRREMTEHAATRPSDVP